MKSDARMCRECGATDECGWNDPESADSFDPFDSGIASDDFDYDEFVAREFPAESTAKVSPWLGIVILAILASFVLTLFSR